MKYLNIENMISQVSWFMCFNAGLRSKIPHLCKNYLYTMWESNINVFSTVSLYLGGHKSFLFESVKSITCNVITMTCANTFHSRMFCDSSKQETAETIWFVSPVSSFISLFVSHSTTDDTYMCLERLTVLFVVVNIL